jgi:hypothetical protein
VKFDEKKLLISTLIDLTTSVYSDASLHEYEVKVVGGHPRLEFEVRADGMTFPVAKSDKLAWENAVWKIQNMETKPL